MNQPLRSGFYLLDSAEALLDEATNYPREGYDQAWYLIKLFQVERLLDDFRPTHSEVGDKNFAMYDKREQEIRRRYGKFADTVDPTLREEIWSGMKKYDMDISRLPIGAR